jgi:hypothetical protein
LTGERQPPSGSEEQIETAKRSKEVVARQNVPGKSAQSAFVMQPGVQSSPLGVEMQALGSPVKLPALGPIPAQSEAWAHTRVHQAPLHVRPATHVFAPPTAHGSPMPDSVQIGHLCVRHESIATSVVTLPA